MKGLKSVLFDSYRDRVNRLELENEQLKDVLKNKNDIIVCLEVDKTNLWKERERALEDQKRWFKKYWCLYEARAKRRKKPLGKSAPRKHK